MRANPIGGLINLAAGWFVMAFLQAAARCLIAGDSSEFGRREPASAFSASRPESS
jgi:hypothetical protein